jgi:hypothetical protein
MVIVEGGYNLPEGTPVTAADGEEEHGSDTEHAISP